jgi:hypothetical protein
MDPFELCTLLNDISLLWNGGIEINPKATGQQVPQVYQRLTSPMNTPQMSLPAALDPNLPNMGRGGGCLVQCSG